MIGAKFFNAVFINPDIYIDQLFDLTAFQQNGRCSWGHVIFLKKIVMGYNLKNTSNGMKYHK